MVARKSGTDPFKVKTSSFMLALKRTRRPVEVTLEQLREALTYRLKQAPLCFYCRKGLTLGNVSLDHDVPVSRGGRNQLINICFPCKSCNKSKGDMTAAEYQELLRSLDVLEAKFRNFTIKKRVVTSLSISQSFRQGIMRRAKKS